jgi:hypothetical protein
MESNQRQECERRSLHVGKAGDPGQCAQRDRVDQEHGCRDQRRSSLSQQFLAQSIDEQRVKAMKEKDHDQGCRRAWSKEGVQRHKE